MENKAAFYIYSQDDGVKLKVVDSNGRPSYILFGNRENILKLGCAMIQWYIKEKECSE